MSLNGEVIDSVYRALLALGRQRQIVLAVPQYSALKTLIKYTLLVAVVPDYVAKTMIRQGGLRMEAIPLNVPALDLSMSWSATSDTDTGERLWRSRISSHLCEKGATIEHLVSAKKAA